MRRRLLLLEEDEKLYLYKNGNRCINATGDYNIYGIDSGLIRTMKPGEYKYNNDNIYIRAVETNTLINDVLVLFCCKKQINTTKYNKLCATIKCTAINSKTIDPSICIMIPLTPLTSLLEGYKSYKLQITTTANAIQIEADISNVNGLNWIQFGAYQANGFFYEVWLER